MAEELPAVPGALAPDRFFGRVEELALLRGESRLLARGAGRSRVLCARPGWGKTELLRQWHGRLFREGAIFPFWYSFSAAGTRCPARGFVAALAQQALAFRRRDPLLFARVLAPAQLAEELRSAWGEAADLFAEAEALIGPHDDDPAALARAALLPDQLAARTGMRVLCLLDDIGELAAAPGGGRWPREAIASPLAPVLATVDDEGRVAGVFGTAAASALTFHPLAPLSVEAASRLARHLARTAGLELGDHAVAALADASAGSPFYLGALIRALAVVGGTRPLDVTRVAAAAACGGELARYWQELLSRAMPQRRTLATAVEILTYCLREGAGSPDAGRLATRMLKPEDEVDAALAGLSRAGVVRLECTRVEVDADPVLHDVVHALYRREFGRMTPAAVVATLAAEKARSAPAARRHRWREDVRAAVREILAAWSGQRVPADLFDAAGARDQTDLIALPHVVSVASGRIGAGVSLPGLELDAVAWALRDAADSPEAEVAWVVRLLPGGAGAEEQFARFDRDVAALRISGELPGSRVVRWAILEAPLDGAGQAAASRLKLSTSGWPHLEALAGLLGVAVSLPPPGAATPAAPDMEIELVIPRADDVELVAARALEQFAENLAVDTVAVGRLKTAVVEACINAFEHSGAPGGRVRLVFSVGGGRLTVRVENRGRPLAALPVAAAPGHAARGRGWGLTLIRELVDEVSLEPREDGVSLVMVKHLGGR